MQRMNENRALENKPLGDLFGDLASEVSELVRKEVALAKLEIGQTAKHVGRNVGYLVVDVLGYYVPQMSAYINEDGSLYIGSRVVSSTRVDVGLYEITFDTDITACNAVVAPATGGYTAGVFPDGAVAAVQITDIEGALADGYFNVVVIC